MAEKELCWNEKFQEKFDAMWKSDNEESESSEDGDKSSQEESESSEESSDQGSDSSYSTEEKKSK